MAEVDPSLVPHTLGGILGWVSTGLLAAFTAWTQFRKGKVDETGQVLTAWQEMVKRHEATMTAMETRLNTALGTIDTLRSRVFKLEDENASLKEELRGLRAQMAQMIKSSGNMIRFGETLPPRDPDEDLLRRID